MTISINIWALILAFGIPTAFTGFFFWLLQRRMTRREAKQDEREASRIKNEVLTIQGVNAAISVAEATAKAVQRIPDAHCNGDMHAALDYAQKIREKQNEFLLKQGVENIYKEGN